MTNAAPAKNLQRGLFITFEGVEGAGKTTNIEFIAERVRRAGHDYILTREPGGTEIGERIREILLTKSLTAMHHDTELLLMFAARAEHYHKVILPAVQSGKWVLCDRFTDASYAYQGGGRGIPVERIEQLENWVLGDFRPDYTFLFDIDVETGIQRARSRGETDRFEEEQMTFFNQVRQQYQAMARTHNKRYRVIHAQHDLPTVQQQIKRELDVILHNNVKTEQGNH